MRLGADNIWDCASPEQWVERHLELGYRAAIWPLSETAEEQQARAYAQAAQAHDLLIAEVGVWKNPISPDESIRHAALDQCKARLAVADLIGARCCVNVAGSRNRERGPHPDNFSDETFRMIVESVQEIIDAVQPVNTYYTLEPLPWIAPDSIHSYEALIQAIDRERFAVHYDPVNIITNARQHCANGSYMREFIRRLGPRIRSVHAKDTILRPGLTSHLDELACGQGALDFETLLTEIERLDPQMPIIVEHLDNDEQYKGACEHLRQVAERVGVSL